MYQNFAHMSVLVKCKPLLTNSACSRFTKSSSRKFARSWYKQKECFETSDANTVPAPSSLLKPAVFTVLISSASFTGAAIWQYENMRYHVQQAFRTPKKWLQGKMKPSHMWLEERSKSGFQMKQGSFRKLCNSWWNSMTEGQKMFISIAFVNVVVFLSWKVPALSGFMSRYFVSHSVNKISCWSLLLCTFSHSSVVHLCMNMMVLNAFTSSLVDHLGKEQFLAFYISAGVFSSLFSSANRVLRGQAISSLGASGSIMGMLAYFCFQYPDNLLSIVFLPSIVFKASTGIKTLLTFDLMGCLFFKRSILDHAGHLGGALFGIFWYYWGNTHLWQKRAPLLEWWHEYRTRSMR